MLTLTLCLFLNGATPCALFMPTVTSEMMAVVGFAARTAPIYVAEGAMATTTSAAIPSMVEIGAALPTTKATLLQTLSPYASQLSGFVTANPLMCAGGVAVVVGGVLLYIYRDEIYAWYQGRYTSLINNNNGQSSSGRSEQESGLISRQTESDLHRRDFNPEPVQNHAILEAEQQNLVGRLMPLAEDGELTSQLALASFYDDNGDMDRSKKWWSIAAINGDGGYDAFENLIRTIGNTTNFFHQVTQILEGAGRRVRHVSRVDSTGVTREDRASILQRASNLPRTQIDALMEQGYSIAESMRMMIRLCNGHSIGTTSAGSSQFSSQNSSFDLLPEAAAAVVNVPHQQPLQTLPNTPERRDEVFEAAQRERFQRTEATAL